MTCSTVAVVSNSSIAVVVALTSTPMPVSTVAPKDVASLEKVEKNVPPSSSLVLVIAAVRSSVMSANKEVVKLVATVSSVEPGVRVVSKSRESISSVKSIEIASESRSRRRRRFVYADAFTLVTWSVDVRSDEDETRAFLNADL